MSGNNERIVIECAINERNFAKCLLCEHFVLMRGIMHKIIGYVCKNVRK